MKKLILTFIFLINSAHAAFMFDTNTGFSTTSDSKTTTDTSDMTNNIFIGASLGQRQRFFIGQNVTFYNHQIKQTDTDKVSTLELGPRMMYFFSDENVFYITAAWNPYAKGTRTVAGTTEDISGFSLFAGIGAEVKINRSFHIGGSLNYRSLSISKAISASNVATTVSDSYTSLMPMINMSFRFR